MALSFALIHPHVPAFSVGNMKARLVRVTPDSSLLAGGEAIEASDLGLSEILAIFVNPSTPLTSGTNNYVTATRTDANSWTLQMWETGAAADASFAEANADDVSAMRIDLLVLGY